MLGTQVVGFLFFFLCNYVTIMKGPLKIAILSWLVCQSLSDEASSKSRVAVIGGGIGGTTAALFLREELGEDVEIVIFEKDKIGGRLATVEVGGRFYESGGAVIHPRNQYMSNLTKTLGLKEATDFPIPLTFGLYDGQDILFQTHRYRFFSSFANKMRLLWRYGFDLFRLDPWISGLLNWYDDIYPAQARKTAFTSVYDMFHSLNALFDDLVTSAIGSYLTHLGFGKRFTHEIARIAMRNNYGQDLEIHAFVGAISLAGAQGGLWSVRGGNYRVAEAAWEKSGARLVKNKVTEVVENEAGKGRRFVITSVDPNGESSDDEYDAVILAVPCTTAGCAGIKFSVEGIDAKLTKFPDSYHRTVANFVKGKLNTQFFGVANSRHFPDSLYAVADEQLLFQSISRKCPVDYGTYPNDPKKVSDLDVYKIFTSKPLTTHHVNRLFRTHSEFVFVDWKAYPNYDEIRQDAQASLPSFVLDTAGAFVSVNAIETAASAMEQSVLGAKNAALLISKYLQNS